MIYKADELERLSIGLMKSVPHNFSSTFKS